jgi:thiol-disulfide isomerase/thioredoxin
MTINRRTALAALLMSAMPLGVVCAQSAHWKLGDRITPPPLTLLDGSPVNWNSLKGQVIILEFWGSWCPFCSRQNPVLDRFYRQHRDKGLEVITISLDKTPQAAATYMKKGGYAFKAGMVTPEWNEVYKQRRGLPQLFAIDRDGRLAVIEVREMLEDEIEDLSKLL